MLIIAGHLEVDPSQRDAYVAECATVVAAARSTPGCLDFSITADTVEPSRVCIHELWDSEAALLTFRGSGPSGDQQVAILAADVRRHTISAVGEA